MGKGTHAGVKRLQSFMRSLVRNGDGDAYFLQLDIRNFFNSIDRRILFKLLQWRLRKAVQQNKIDEDTAVRYRDISHIILKQDVGRESYVLASPREMAVVPAHKRLVNSGKNKGLAIGNLTSQFFANVYLNELDQFVKHRLKCRFYLRYVDDFILLHSSAEQLSCWHLEIEKFLEENLRLALKQPEAPLPVNQGADFLGYIIRPDYLLVRQRVVGNLWEKLRMFEAKLIKGNSNRGWVITLLPELRDNLRSVLASYLGHIKHASHHRLTLRVLKRFPWISCLFRLLNDRFIPLWQPHSVSSYKGQQRYFRNVFPNARILIQCGWSYDCLKAAGKNQLIPGNPRQFVSKVIVRQQGYLKGGLRRRCVESISILPFNQSGVLLCKSYRV